MYTHLARVSGLMRMLKQVLFNCSVIIVNTAGVELNSAIVNNELKQQLRRKEKKHLRWRNM